MVTQVLAPLIMLLAVSASADAAPGDVDAEIRRAQQLAGKEQVQWLRSLESRLNRANDIVLPTKVAAERRTQVATLLRQPMLSWDTIRALLEEIENREERAVQELSQKYRIVAIDAFFGDRPEYDRRREALTRVSEAWQGSKRSFENRPKMIDWLQTSLESMRAAAPMPEDPAFDSPVDQSAEGAPPEPSEPPLAPAAPAEPPPAPPAEAIPAPSTAAQPAPQIEVPRELPMEENAAADADEGVAQSPTAQPHPVELQPVDPPPTEQGPVAERPVEQPNPVDAMPAPTSAAPSATPANDPAPADLMPEEDIPLPVEPSEASVAEPASKDELDTFDWQGLKALLEQTAAAEDAPPANPPPPPIEPQSDSPRRRPPGALSVKPDRTRVVAAAPLNRPPPLFALEAAPISQHANGASTQGVLLGRIVGERPPIGDLPSEAKADLAAVDATDAEALDSRMPQARVNISDLAARIAGASFELRGLEDELADDEAWTVARVTTALTRLSRLVQQQRDLETFRRLLPAADLARVGECEPVQTAIAGLARRIVEVRQYVDGASYPGDAASRRADLKLLSELSDQLGRLGAEQ